MPKNSAAPPPSRDTIWWCVLEALTGCVAGSEATRVWFSGRTSPFQGESAGSIPATRSVVQPNSDTQYHPAVWQIITLLQQHDCWFQVFEHPPVRTSQEAAEIRSGYSLHQGAKAIIVRVKLNQREKKFVMLVVPGDTRFQTAKVKKIFGAKDVRFATEAEVAQITAGILPGGVPPFGNLFALPVLVDPVVLENEQIIFNAGDRAVSVAIFSRDYQRLVLPQVVALV